MKKSVKLTAAALAAITAMSCASFASFADTAPDTAVESTYLDLPVAGGWQVNEGSTSLSKNPGAKAAFKKATAQLDGVSYKAIALLGTQVVAGTNYAVLCRSTVVYPDAQPEIKIMYIYEDLQGNVEITGFRTIIGEQLMGGFSANSGKFPLKNNKTVKKAYTKAMKGLTGVSYTPVAYLGSQVVAGTNYMVLCRSRVVYPNAPYEWSLVTVYKDLKGKASLNEIEKLDLGKRDDDIAEEENGDIMVGIANPWSEYKTVGEAAKAAGVKFDAPEKLGKYKTSYIQAMKGIAEVRYSNGKKEISIRKGTGTDDISGDYNEYEKTDTVKKSGVTVTLRMNGDTVYGAVWTVGDNSYAYFVRDGISRKTALSHISKLVKA